MKLIFPDTTLTADQKLNKMRIMNLHKQLEYNKGSFMYKILNKEPPEYISNLHKRLLLRYSDCRNHHHSLPRPRIGIF